MAVVSSMPDLRQQLEGNRSYTERSVMESIGETEEELLERSERIFVAVGKDSLKTLIYALKTLIYALKNARGKTIGILHVHQPASTIPMLGGKFPVDTLDPCQVRAYREQEKQKMHKILDEYVHTCSIVGVQAEKFIKEMDDIERGIVELVAEHGVSKLFMGAAADKHYSRKMRIPKSKKAITVSREADLSCKIWFVCKGNLVCTREASLYGTGVWVIPPLPVSNPSTTSAKHIQLKSSSVPQTKSKSLIPDHLWRSKSDNFASRGGGATASVEETRRIITPLWEGLSVASPSEVLTWSTCEDGVGTMARDEEGLTITPVHESEEDIQLPSPMNHSVKELGRSRDQQKALEIQAGIANELKEKLASTQHLLNTVEREREELQRERDDAVREEDKLRKEYEDAATSSHRAQNLSLFSVVELEEATDQFDNSFKIGKGGYGSVYMGNLRHTKVAIKMLNPQSMQGSSEFDREVEVLSRVRHPNLVTLIGTCPETWSLIYEYLPNGSLEDRLICKEGTPPLSWKIRTRIAAEICSALIFLHCNRPQMIIHGDLKPANILLDSNFVSKLGDFGISRLILPENSTTTNGWMTDPKGTFPYMDPEILLTGIPTHKSDVYSFGIIILQLLTGKPALGILNEVKEALEKGNLYGILDNSAGDWPFVQAKQLAHLGLRCCDMQRKNRPDLVSEVSRVLDPMRASLGSSSSSSHLMSQEEAECHPTLSALSKEILRNPQVAADGFTYEA